MTEDLGDEQRFGNGAAIDRHEVAAPAAEPVDVARHQLLAGAGLAGDVHWHVQGHCWPEIGHGPLQCRIGAGELLFGVQVWL